jgi:capsular exopolysaccharide synthesis family protein
MIPKEEQLIEKMLDILLAYWPVFLVFAIISFSGATLYLRYGNPEYQANASMIIKDETKGNEDSKMVESLNLIGQKKIIENEMEVIQSRLILEEVVRNLHLTTPVYIANLIVGKSAYKVAPIFVEMDVKPHEQLIKRKIYFTLDKVKNKVRLNDSVDVSTNKWVKTKYGNFKFTINPLYSSKVAEKPFYFEIKEVDQAVKDISDRLKVTAVNKLSSMVNLQYRDATPKLAEDILNEIINTYTRVALTEKRKMAINTLEFIDSRLLSVSNDIDKIENRVKEYKDNREAVDISTQGQIYLQNVSVNDRRLGELDVQISVLNDVQNKISNNDKIAGVLTTSLGVVDPALNQLLTNLNNAELEQEKLKSTVAENNPMLIAVNGQLANSKQKIVEQISTYKKSLEASREQLKSTTRSYNRMLQDLPQKEQVLLEITRDLRIKNDIYSFLLQKKEEAALASIATISESQIINYAHASKDPVNPKKMILYGSVLLGVFIIPFGSIQARERFSQGILYRNEIANATDLPIIGEISHSNQENTAVDEFRKLRHAISTNEANNNKIKRILITSSITGEGKSYIASNLAKSYESIGKRVVLVDFDLHNSSLKDQFNKQYELGVSDFLSQETEVSISEILHSIPARNQLSIIAAGSQHEDPSRLIENEDRVNELLSQLEDQFDVIILDSAPMVEMSDAYLLSQYCDITLFIVKHDYSPKKLIQLLDINNEVMPLNNPFIVFNGVKTRGYLKSNYGYGYGYKMAYRREAKYASL